jgi:redox-regulated HSP33 family molecular chaperone
MSSFTVKALTAVESTSATAENMDRFLVTLVGKKPLQESLFGTGNVENGSMTVVVKEYGRVRALVTDVMNKTTVQAVKAESYFILGRLFHAQNNILYAIDYYREAYRMCPG